MKFNYNSDPEIYAETYAPKYTIRRSRPLPDGDYIYACSHQGNGYRPDFSITAPNDEEFEAQFRAMIFQIRKSAWVEVKVKSRYCKNCETTKDAKFFYKNARNADGLSTYCKPCTIERSKERQARDKARRGLVNSRHDHKTPEELRSRTEEHAAKAAMYYGLLLQKIKSEEITVPSRINKINGNQLTKTS